MNKKLFERIQELSGISITEGAASIVTNPFYVAFMNNITKNFNFTPQDEENYGDGDGNEYYFDASEVYRFLNNITGEENIMAEMLSGKHEVKDSNPGYMAAKAIKLLSKILLEAGAVFTRYSIYWAEEEELNDDESDFVDKGDSGREPPVYIIVINVDTYCVKTGEKRKDLSLNIGATNNDSDDYTHISLSEEAYKPILEFIKEIVDNKDKLTNELENFYKDYL